MTVRSRNVADKDAGRSANDVTDRMFNAIRAALGLTQCVVSGKGYGRHSGLLRNDVFQTTQL